VGECHINHGGAERLNMKTSRREFQ
jgi:hypothetical protein